MSITEKKKFKLKYEYVVAIILLVAVVMVIAGTFFDNDSKSDNDLELDSYTNSLQQKLQNALKEINGIEGVAVVITTSGGLESVIMSEIITTEKNGETLTTTKPILVGGQPIVLKTIYPEITGVLIVVSGKETLTTKLDILVGTTTALNISQEKVEILWQ